jgi:hypothetical protein
VTFDRAERYVIFITHCRYTTHFDFEEEKKRNNNGILIKSDILYSDNTYTGCYGYTEEKLSILACDNVRSAYVCGGKHTHKILFHTSVSFRKSQNSGGKKRQ